jgi:2-oxoglutarate ferredoxin oxidoreductase subunit beta
VLKLRKLAAEHDPTDKLTALSYMQRHQAKGEIVTGLLYVDPESEEMHDRLHTVERPLNALAEPDLCPGSGALGKVNASLR